MFLSQLVNKEIWVGETARGVCQGIGISLKTQGVKYLLCSSSPTSRAQFAVPVSSVKYVGERIILSRLRPVFPKSCACLFLHLPVYAYDGTFMGEVLDVEIEEFIALTMFTGGNEDYPVSAISACADAVLLKKELPFPLGQRIPAPVLSHLTGKTDGLVTRPLLRAAIQKNALVALTLSLPPFDLDITK